MTAPRPTVSLGGRAVSTFQACGLVGFAAALATALVVGAHVGLPLGFVTLLGAAAVAAFFWLALATRAILDEERLVYYHHELAVLVLSALVAGLARQPIGRALDVAVVALGVFLAFGRVGCFAVGCCHGRPHRLGVRYHDDHAAVGFPDALVGVPLVPVQAIESGVVLALTASSAARLWAGAPAGATLATQLVGYALVRFALELWRGDVTRPFVLSLSEAQWLSCALALAVVGGERAGWLPPSRWHGGAAALLALAVVVLALRRARQGSAHRLWSPAHVAEVAAALADRAAVSAPVRVHTTSLGVRLSTTVVDDAGGRRRLYLLSGIDPPSARALSSLILRLRPPRGRHELRQRPSGLFQLIVGEDAR